MVYYFMSGGRNDFTEKGTFHLSKAHLGVEPFRVEGTASEKSLRQKHTWCGRSKAMRTMWQENE